MSNPWNPPPVTMPADALIRANQAWAALHPPIPFAPRPPVDFSAIEEILLALAAEIARQKARSAGVSATPKSAADLIAEALSK